MSSDVTRITGNVMTDTNQMVEQIAARVGPRRGIEQCLRDPSRPLQLKQFSARNNNDVKQMAVMKVAIGSPPYGRSAAGFKCTRSASGLVSTGAEPKAGKEKELAMENRNTASTQMQIKQSKHPITEIGDAVGIALSERELDRVSGGQQHDKKIIAI